MTDGTKSAAARLAAAKVAQLNAKLRAKGAHMKREVLLPKSGEQNSVPKQQQMPVVHTAEIEINDLDSRGLILKSNIQDQIGQWTGTTLVTRGRYIPKHRQSEIANMGDRPLYIHISAVNREWNCTERAIHFVLAVLHQNKIPPGSKGISLERYPDHTLLKICQRDLDESTVPFSERVYCDMKDQPLPWNIKQEIEGQDGCFIEHIVKSTNAKITMRGILSGHFELETGKELKEPLFIQINHSSLEGLVEAKRLVDSLLFTVHEKIREKRKDTGFKSHGAPTSNAVTYPTGPSNLTLTGSAYPAGLKKTGYPKPTPPQNSSFPQPHQNPASGYPEARQNTNFSEPNPEPENTGYPTRHQLMRNSFPVKKDRGFQGANRGAGGQREMGRDSRGGRDSSGSRWSDLGNSRAPPKRRFQESTDGNRKRRSKDNEKSLMPPPPPGPVTAGNVSDWIKEAQHKDDERGPGRGRYERTIVCDYSDSDED